MSKTKFKLIKGGFSDEEARLFEQLKNAPHTFEQAEFERLMDYFRPYIPFEHCMRIVEKKIRLGANARSIGYRALLAILTGNDRELERMNDILERCHRRGWKCD